MNDRKISRFPLPSPAVAGLFLLAAFAATPSAADHDEDKQHADAMHQEHQHEKPTPSKAVEAEPAQPVEVEEVVYATIEGRNIKGYLARPKGSAKNTPALIVIQEWWGLNDGVKAATRRLAGEGYQALAVDLYEGKAAQDAEAARALMTAAMQNTARVEDNLRQAQRWLKAERGAGKVGVLGWCFGGAWSLQTALALGDGIDAAVMYYGRVVTDKERLKALQAPLLGLFGELDKGIPVASVREMEKALQELGKHATIVIYPNADHAFANPSGERYQAAAAEDSWVKATAFLKEHLGSGPSR
jgi:carboxymethylenebutenolidase